MTFVYIAGVMAVFFAFTLFGYHMGYKDGEHDAAMRAADHLHNTVARLLIDAHKKQREHAERVIAKSPYGREEST